MPEFEALVQHMADARRNARRRLIMIRCYLDDSGTDGGQPTVTMAGYLAPYKAWKSYERAARKHFKASGVEFFHAKEFHDRKRQFEGWTLTQKDAFIHGWVDIGHDHGLTGITVSMAREKFERHKKEHSRHLKTSAYGHCFDCLINFLLSDDQVGGQILEHGLSFMVEAGTKGNAGVVEIFNKRRQRDAAPYLQQLSLIDKRSCYAVQFADFLAFYSRRHGSHYIKQGDITMPPYLYLAKEKIRTIAQLAGGFVQVSTKVDETF